MANNCEVASRKPVSRTCGEPAGVLRCFLLAAAVAIGGGYALAMMAEFKQEIMAEMQKKDDAFKEEIKKKDEALADFMAEMQKKDEMIAALKGKTDHKQVQMSAGGEVVELVSAADLKELETRVEACEKGLAAQDAKIGALRDKPTPPNPPATARPPAAARRQLSSGSGDETEFAITGRRAIVSFNSRTPDLTATSLTGEGGGKLTCSGELHATDFVTAEGGSITERIEALRENFTDELEAVRKFVSSLVLPPQPPASPPSVPPPGEFMVLGGTAADEGSNLGGELIVSLETCVQRCNANLECHSFAFNPNKWGGDQPSCFLKDKCHTTTSPLKAHNGWTTHYKSCR